MGTNLRCRSGPRAGSAILFIRYLNHLRARSVSKENSRSVFLVMITTEQHYSSSLADAAGSWNSTTTAKKVESHPQT